MKNPDSLPGTEKNMYEVSWLEVFGRNVVAGMGRALGSLVLYVVVILVLGNLFIQNIWPIIEPIVNSFQQSSQVMQEIQGLRGLDKIPELNEQPAGLWR
ncbi:MAG: hypothetical protein COY80_01775 [Candidatus Pacebacteria bacterium CG_4_10_14_0_8_um_filter_42_14]|nr:MAG: hypothetical protein COY80_01775 [Candidatus Pacebacteria bacterium CG_4_10_14_0_8_um_filter_42_14]